MCVLLVDDEPLILMLLEETLRDAGFEVMSSTDPSGAMTLLRDYPGHFSALVTDIHMPGGRSGADLVTHVRQHHPRMPVVISTGRPDALWPDWVKLHRVQVLRKPYEMETLVEMMRWLVG